MRGIFSEFGLLKFRVQVEVRWLQKSGRSTQRSRKFLLLLPTQTVSLDKIVADFMLGKTRGAHQNHRAHH
ncbi:hypothetical protein MJ585_11190 [Klebsiella pneumoniae]|nr:hypothetical protein MJ585_11190 [Klebsiella pneumoniae]